VRSALAAGAFVLALALAVAAVALGAPAWACAMASAGCVAVGALALAAGSAPPGADRAQEARVYRAHLGALAAGLLPGIALVALLGQARMALPFGVVVVLGLAALAALDRAWRRL
jgi:hypothetical protein